MSRSSFFARSQVGHVGEDEAAVVGGVLAEGELAVDVDVIDGDEAAVLVDEAVGAGFEVLLVVGCPPVAEVAVGVELAALSSKPWVSSWPMTAPMWP